MQFWVTLWIYLLFVIEAALVVLAFASQARFGGTRRFFGAVARSRSAPLIACAAAILLRLAILPIEPVPVPAVHDEFSYLLAADTFVHGRLANPTHPMWQHFETMQIEQQPTYVSMYPPLQGLVLAAGEAAAGSAFAGVLLSIGFMCGAICWGLRGWFSAEWAFTGAMLAVLRYSVFTYWGNSYWGGAVAAGGGALLFGAVPRLIRGSRARDAVLAAIGTVMLANTRPYEGLVFAVAAGLLLVLSFRRLRLRAIVPAFLLVAVPAGAWMAYYNWRAFGSPATLPYTIDRQTYEMARLFLFQPPLPAPAYRHQALRDYYAGWELNYFEHARTAAGYLDVTLSKIRAFWLFFLGPALTIPLIACFWTRRSRRTRSLFLMAAVMTVGMCLVPWFMPHYAAPATVLLLAIIVQGLRALRQWRLGVAYGMVAVCIAMAAIRIVMAVVPVPFVLNYPMTWAATWSPHLERNAVEQQLHVLGGRHLVIVRYAAGHDPTREYVFNGADIDGQEIVWARDMDAEHNAELCRYFAGRRSWLLEPDLQPPRLTPDACGAR